MAPFSMIAAGQGDESSDSDHSQKRHKTNTMSNSKLNAPTDPDTLPTPNSIAAKIMAKMGFVEAMPPMKDTTQ